MHVPTIIQHPRHKHVQVEQVVGVLPGSRFEVTGSAPKVTKYVPIDVRLIDGTSHATKAVLEGDMQSAVPAWGLNRERLIQVPRARIQEVANYVPKIVEAKVAREVVQEPLTLAQEMAIEGHDRRGRDAGLVHEAAIVGTLQFFAKPERVVNKSVEQLALTDRIRLNKVRPRAG